MHAQDHAIFELDSLVQNLRHSDWSPSGLDDLPGLVERLRGCAKVLSQSDSRVIGIEHDSTYEEGARALLERYHPHG